MTDVVNETHPRPQLTRDRWISLDGPWGFAHDDSDVGLQELWQESDAPFDRIIQVPFPPESPASGIGDRAFHPIVWYRRTFTMALEDVGKRMLLHCGAVDYRAQAWVNGRLVAIHEGGHTPFSADITAALNADGEQVIVIRADDQPWDLSQPRGKQDWQEHPHSIWYHRTSGIWQPVWLEPVSDTHISSIRWIPDLDRGAISVAIALQRRDWWALAVRVQLTLHGIPVADDLLTVQGTEIRRELALDLGTLAMSRTQVLWSPNYPNLFDATISLMAGDEVIDVVYSYVGMRSVDVAGGRFLLNGQPYYLRMALEQGYWPETHLAAPSDDALRREVELAKELGFNGLRLHQKVEDPRFLYWCDRLGLLVWGEMANAYVFSQTGVERFTREWLEVVARDSNHPCIALWVPLNESWGIPNLRRDPAQQNFVRSIYHLTKALDPSRPTIGNDGWEYVAGDVLSVHDYTFNGDTIRERYGSTEAVNRTLKEVQPQYHFVALSDGHHQDMPLMLTEFGGISYRPESGERWFGYGTVSDAQAYVDKYRELVEAVLDCPPIAGFCYTQFTDTLQETNGLLTPEREPKFDPSVIRTINRRPSVAVPGDIVAQVMAVTGLPFGASPSSMNEGDTSGAPGPIPAAGPEAMQ